MQIHVLGKGSVPRRTDSQHGSVSAAVTLSELRQQGVEAQQMCVRHFMFTLGQDEQQHRLLTFPAASPALLVAFLCSLISC